MEMVSLIWAIGECWRGLWLLWWWCIWEKVQVGTADVLGFPILEGGRKLLRLWRLFFWSGGNWLIRRWLDIFCWYNRRKHHIISPNLHWDTLSIYFLKETFIFFLYIYPLPLTSLSSISIQITYIQKPVYILWKAWIFCFKLRLSLLY